MGADVWVVVGAVGSAVGGLATIAAAALAGRIAWLTAYGARPWISGLRIGRKALNTQKKNFVKTLGLTITNRQKVPVTLYRVDICVPGEEFTGGVEDAKLVEHERENKEPLIIASKTDGDTVRLRLKIDIKAGASVALDFHIPIDGRGGATTQNARYMALLQRDEPHIASFWITREIDSRKMDNGFLRMPPRSMRWFITRMRDRIAPQKKWGGGKRGE